MATSGTLHLTIVEARLTRDTEMFGEMDPFVQVESRMQKMRTKTIEEAGKTPVWNETVEIDVKYIGDNVTLRIKDENVTDVELIGETEIKLSAFCVSGGIDDWWQISYDGKKAGDIHLKGRWEPKGSDPVSVSAAAMPGLQQTFQQQTLYQAQQAQMQPVQNFTSTRPAYINP